VQSRLVAMRLAKLCPVCVALARLAGFLGKPGLICVEKQISEIADEMGKKSWKTTPMMPSPEPELSRSVTGPPQPAPQRKKPPEQ
jgi:hypothetical protein